MFLGGLSTGRAGGSFPAAALASLSHRGLHLFGNFLFWKIASLIVRTRSIELKLDSVVHLLQRLVGEALAVNAKRTLPRRALATERPHVITVVPSSNLCWHAVYLTGVWYL
jgi:hypothetical protein